MVKDNARMAPAGDRTLDVLMATYNGASTLPSTLAAMEAQQAPQRPWRLLVVDNASTDETPAILRAFADRLPLTVIPEPRPGKTIALATGIEHLRGDLTIMTDDDVIPVPGWLRAYEAAADAHPDYDLFGGPIEPTPIEPLDPWYEATGSFSDVLFARVDHADGPVDPSAYLFGPNYMARTVHVAELIRQMQGFGPDQTSTFALGDETVALDTLARRGVKAWFVQAAAVKHQVRRRYTTLDYMLKRAQRKGRGVAGRRIKSAADVSARLGILARSSLGGVSQYLQQVGRARDVPDPTLFRTLYHLNFHIGAIRGAMKGPFVGSR